MPRNAWTSFVKQCSLYLPPDEVIRFINNGNDSARMKRYTQEHKLEKIRTGEEETVIDREQQMKSYSQERR